MKSVIFYSMICASCLLASTVYADIYQWTDGDGTKHFTNIPPPTGDAIVTVTEEIPYDEAADLARMEKQRQEQLNLDQMALAQREAVLLLKEAETERRLAESERHIEETLKEAEDYLDEVKNDDSRYRRYGYYYPRYYGYSPYFKKPYHRKKFRHRYFKKWHHKAPHQHAKQKSNLSKHKNPRYSKIDGKRHLGAHLSILKSEKAFRSRHVYRNRHIGKRHSGLKR